MREIAFRGKSKHGKKKRWVYGNLRIIADYVGIETLTINPPDAVDTEVDPETVGEYTGLKDKNGVKIFEGDVVKSDKYCLDEDPVIRYADGGFGVDGGLMLVFQVLETLEVIGNIHDNPELLEEEEQ